MIDKRGFLLYHNSMENKRDLHTDGAHLPVCHVITDHPELKQMIAAMLCGHFAVSDTEAPELVIRESGGFVILSDPRKTRELRLERPFGRTALVDAAYSIPAAGSIGFTADGNTLSVSLGETSVQLTPTEFRLFSAIADAGGQYMTATELSEAVWGKTDRNLCTVYISYLRRKLDSAFGDGTLLTVRGKGYRLREPG